jgi:hypothetical protein
MRLEVDNVFLGIIWPVNPFLAVIAFNQPGVTLQTGLEFVIWEPLMKPSKA